MKETLIAKKGSAKIFPHPLRRTGLGNNAGDEECEATVEKRGKGGRLLRSMEKKKGLRRSEIKQRETEWGGSLLKTEKKESISA